MKSCYWYILRKIYVCYYKSIANLLNFDYTQINRLEFARGCHGCDHMVVRFTTTYAISAYQH